MKRQAWPTDHVDVGAVEIGGRAHGTKIHIKLKIFLHKRSFVFDRKKTE